MPLGSPDMAIPDWFVKECDDIGCDQDDIAKRWPKRPLVKFKQYQKNPPTLKQFNQWVKDFPDCNWGLLTDQVQVLDADTAQGVALLKSGKLTATSCMVQTGREGDGCHAYYIANDEVPISNNAHILSAGSESKLGEIKSSGGFVVLPGSLHSSGKRYMPIGDFNLADWETNLAEFTADDYEICTSGPVKARKKNVAKTPKTEVTPRKVKEIAGALEALDYDDRTIWLKVGQCLHSMDPANEKLLDLWDEWSSESAKYVRKECRNKWEGFTQGKGLEIEWLFSSAYDAGWSGGSSSIRIKVKKKAANVEPHSDEGETRGSARHRGLELLQDKRPQPPEIIKGLIRQGDRFLVAGPPKSYKSFFMQELALSLALGKQFLQFEVPKPQTVFWCQAEMPWHESRERLRRHPLSVEEHWGLLDDNLVITDGESMRFDEVGVEEIIQDLEDDFGETGPDVFMLDSLSSVYAEETEDSSTQMNEFLIGKLGAIRDYFPGITIIILHHMRKAAIDELEKNPFDAIRGSGAIRGWYEGACVAFRDVGKKEKWSDAGKRIQAHFELRGSKEPDMFKLEYDGASLVIASNEIRITAGGRSHATTDEIKLGVKEILLHELEKGKVFSLDKFVKDFGGLVLKLKVSRKDLEKLLRGWVEETHSFYETNTIERVKMIKTVLMPVGYSLRRKEGVYSYKETPVKKRKKTPKQVMKKGDVK